MFRNIFAIACLLSFVSVSHAQPAAETIRVMSFNLWHGGDAGKQPLDQTVEVIKQARADIVGLQETTSFAASGPRPDRSAEIAKRLGWNHLDQGGNTAIISRFKIVTATPRKWGVRLETPTGRTLYHFNAHLAHAPYQPYQLLSIPYHNGPFLKTAEEAIAAAKSARGAQVERLLAEVRDIVSEKTPIFLTGDFNEPSHHDWTAAAAEQKLCPLAVEWPSTHAVVAAGFRDAYRTIHADPIKNPGLTWTPLTKPADPKDHHDRIDFVFAHGDKLTIKSAEVVGENKTTADIIVTPYPSDHRAVVAEVLTK
ncbi:endonuclease/exonuclease/phosphatase family protein [Anatilimnocola floriformis]|uniref:endonuclease/exonuclease/phosphatase family protein n=1 Tax=Anatilimnocola floriformis TaxID=2948575 RepID=UPI0020C54B08|nr:endonuclease/exonuclease/phosphatase family protein [Anatilimnocola floriformis]